MGEIQMHLHQRKLEVVEAVGELVPALFIFGHHLTAQQGLTANSSIYTPFFTSIGRKPLLEAFSVSTEMAILQIRFPLKSNLLPKIREFVEGIPWAGFHVNDAIFTSDGARVITASSDCTVKNPWRKIREFVEGIPWAGFHVNDAIFTSDGVRVITASSDCTVKVWDVKTT